MSDFLALTKLLAREADIAGTGPDSTVNQSGMNGNLAEWTKQAYVDLQNRHQAQWRWLRRAFTLNTVANDDSYAYGDVTDVLAAAPIARFTSWRVADLLDPPKIYLTSAGVGAQVWMIFAEWESFKSIYRIGTQNSGQPVHISVDPDNNLVIGPKPNGVYTLTGEYHRGPQILAVDADVPEMPAQFHKLIVWTALEDYGYHQVGPEALSRAEVKGRRMLRQLEANQLPRLRRAGPLA